MGAGNKLVGGAEGFKGNIKGTRSWEVRGCSELALPARPVGAELYMWRLSKLSNPRPEASK
jgi:hypothetical protein